MSQRKAELGIQEKRGIGEEAIDVRQMRYSCESLETHHLLEYPIRMTREFCSDVSWVYLY